MLATKRVTKLASDTTRFGSLYNATRVVVQSAEVCSSLTNRSKLN